MPEINTQAGKFPAFCRFFYLYYGPDLFISGPIGALSTTGAKKGQGSDIKIRKTASESIDPWQYRDRISTKISTNPP